MDELSEKQEEATRIIESIGTMHLKSLRMTAYDGRSFSSGQKIKVELEDGTVWDAEVSEENTVIEEVKKILININNKEKSN